MTKGLTLHTFSELPPSYDDIHRSRPLNERERAEENLREAIRQSQFWWLVMFGLIALNPVIQAILSEYIDEQWA